MSDERIKLLVAAGAASAIAAAFRAPIAGVFFALEIVLNGQFGTGSFGIVYFQRSYLPPSCRR